MRTRRQKQRQNAVRKRAVKRAGKKTSLINDREAPPWGMTVFLMVQLGSRRKDVIAGS